MTIADIVRKFKYSILLVLSFVSLKNVAGGALHRLFSSSVHAGIYAGTAINVIYYSRNKEFKTSTLFARADLAKEYIVFLIVKVLLILFLSGNFSLQWMSVSFLPVKLMR